MNKTHIQNNDVEMCFCSLLEPPPPHLSDKQTLVKVAAFY